MGLRQKRFEKGKGILAKKVANGNEKAIAKVENKGFVTPVSIATQRVDVISTTATPTAIKTISPSLKEAVSLDTQPAGIKEYFNSTPVQRMVQPIASQTDSFDENYLDDEILDEVENLATDDEKAEKDKKKKKTIYTILALVIVCGVIYLLYKKSK